MIDVIRTTLYLLFAMGAHQQWVLRPTLRSIDPTSPSDDAVSSSVFADRRGFFRANDETSRDLVADNQSGDVSAFLAQFSVDPGPTWNVTEANQRARDFFSRLADGRRVIEHADAFDFVIANELLLLLSNDGEKAFEQHYRRMDDETIRRWQDLLEGGRASEAFGPLSLQEQLDEKQLDLTLAKERKGRWITLGILGFLVIAIVGGGLALLGPDDPPPRGDAFRFEDPTAASSGGSSGSPRPTISGAVVAPVDLRVVVESGEGPASDRVVADPADRLFDARFDELYMVVLAEGGAGRVAVVGPAGWHNELCVVVSSVSSNLRPLSTSSLASTNDSCGMNPAGTPQTPACVGDDVIMLPIDIPAGAVDLDEGGQATVDSIRVKVMAPVDGFEQVSLRGAVDLSVDGAAVIPAFGWSSTESVELDVPISANERRETTCTRVAG